MSPKHSQISVSAPQTPSRHHPQHPTSLREPRASHICSPSIIAPCPPARLRSLEKQPVGRGSICNQTEREQCEISGRGSFSPTLPPPPPPTRIAVGRGSDDEGACLRHSAPPTGPLMQAACKHTPHMYLSAGGGGEGRGEAKLGRLSSTCPPLPPTSLCGRRCTLEELVEELEELVLLQVSGGGNCHFSGTPPRYRPPSSS